jgi:hypothetical protein
MKIWRMRIGCWLFKTTNTQIVSTYCFSAATIVEWRPSILRYTYIAVLLYFMYCASCDELFCRTSCMWTKCVLHTLPILQHVSLPHATHHHRVFAVVIIMLSSGPLYGKCRNMVENWWRMNKKFSTCKAGSITNACIAFVQFLYLADSTCCSNISLLYKIPKNEY